MRKLFAGAVACAVTATSSLVAFAPGAVRAQEDPGLDVLDAELAPAEASAGDEITVTPIDDCSATTGYLAYAVFEAGDFSWENPPDEEGPVLVAEVPLAEDGSWSVTFAAPGPDTGAGGEFSSAAEAAVEEDPEEPEGPVQEVYGPLPLTVDGIAYEWFGICFDYTEPAILTADITSHDDHPDLGFPLVGQADQLSVAPIDACPVTGEGDTAFWSLETWPLDEEDPYEQIDSGYLEVGQDGTWALSFPAPDDGDPAGVSFYALWLDCENDTSITGLYDLLLFAVGDGPVTSPPTEPPTRPESPRPARPVVVAPDFTG